MKTLVLLLAASLAWAEVRLSGRVTNENNTPLAGVRVRISGPAALETTTDPAGLFAVQLPSAGEYYLHADHTGFFRLKDRPITLQEGTQDVLLVLNPVRDILETIEVYEKPSPLELGRNATEQRLDNHEIHAVPYTATNSIRNAMRILPGMVQDGRGGLHLYGAAEEQTLYLLDGFQINDPLTGRFDSRVSIEAVQSVELAGGALAAEYGKGSGGALSITTRAGDDRLRYSGTNFVPGVENHKGLVLGSWTPRFNLSGPILKGRAWFSDSIALQYIKHIVEELPKGEDRTASWRLTNHLHNQVNLTPSNILYTGFLATMWTAPRSGLGVLDPVETTVDRRSRQWFFHVKDQIYFARGFLAEIGFASNRTFGREIPQGHGLFVMTPEGKRGNFFVDSARSAGRDQALANFIMPSFAAAGAHRIKSGLDLQRISYEQDARRTGYEHYRADNTLLRRVVFFGSGALRRSTATAAAYLQDSWQVKPNLLIELGARTDWDRIVKHWSMAPRAAFSWRPRWWENTKISGGFAIVHDEPALRVFTRPLDQYSSATYFDPRGTPVRTGALSIFTIERDRFRLPRYQNWNLGIEQALPASMHGRVSWMRRRGRRGFSYTNTLSPETPPSPSYVDQYRTSLFDAIYGLGNFRRDIYDGVEVQVRQTIDRQYGWMVSYTRSRALSTGALDVTIDEPLLFDDTFGRLAWDTPNRVLSWGYLPTPWKNWAVAYLLETRDGLPFTVSSDDGHVFEEVNSRRFPAFFDLNFHLERRFTFRHYRWALRMGFNNITGHHNPTVVNSNTSSPNFLSYYGSQGRSANFRIRWLGRL